MLGVQTLIVVMRALVLNVMLYRLFVRVLSDRTGVVSVTPELSAPQLLFDLWTLLKNFSRGNAFHGLNDLFDTVHWDGLDEEMDMILIRTDFEKRYVISFTDFKTDLL